MKLFRWRRQREEEFDAEIRKDTARFAPLFAN